MCHLIDNTKGSDARTKNDSSANSITKETSSPNNHHENRKKLTKKKILSLIPILFSKFSFFFFYFFPLCFGTANGWLSVDVGRIRENCTTIRTSVKNEVIIICAINDVITISRITEMNGRNWIEIHWFGLVWFGYFFHCHFFRYRVIWLFTSHVFILRYL